MKEWLEKYKLAIGVVLICLTITGGLILIWQRSALAELVSKNKITNLTEIDNLKLENQDLKNKVLELSNKTCNCEQKIAGAGTETSNNADDADVSGKININSCSLEELDTLPGIGPARAQDITAYRDTNGGFKSIDELKNIKGIGDKTFEKLKDLVSVEDE